LIVLFLRMSAQPTSRTLDATRQRIPVLNGEESWAQRELKKLELRLSAKIAGLRGGALGRGSAREERWLACCLRAA